MISIFRMTNGTETTVAVVSDANATLERGIMGADEVSLSVTVSEPLDARVGDYTRVDGEVYTINREPDVVKASAVEYKYDVVLESPQYNLLDKLYMAATTGKSRFTLNGTLEDFVDLLLVNMNEEGFDAGWSKAEDREGRPIVVETERKTLTFDNASCRDVLNRLAGEFAVEYAVRGRTIAFMERLETVRDVVFEQGMGKGLYTLERQNVDKENTVTRAYVYGSTENLPAGYRDGQVDRLCPRERGTEEYIGCFENRTEYPKLVEREVYFDDVKPSFTGSVASVSADYLQVRCPEIDFDLNTAKGDVSARVNFLTGDLMGKAFGFTYVHETRTLELIPQEDELAQADGQGKRPMLPNATWHPRVGDKFTFTGIELPEAYVRAAEALLVEKGRKWMQVHSSLRVRYNLDVDYRHARETGVTLSPGDVVGIAVPDREEVQRLRVTSVKKQLGTGKLTCEVSNYLTESAEDTMNAKIQEVRNSIELDRNELLYTLNATREWTTRNFGRLAENMEDGQAVVWDADGWEIRTAKQVPDAVNWDTHPFGDYLDQPVRRGDDVRFKKITAEELIEEINQIPLGLQARLLSGEDSAELLNEVREYNGGTLGSLENVDDVVDNVPDGYILESKGGVWKASINDRIPKEKLGNVQINSIKDLVNYLHDYGIGYPEINTPPVLMLQKNYYVFKPEDDFVIDVTCFDKEGGELTLVGKKPVGLGGNEETFTLFGLVAGNTKLNLKDLVFGEGSIENFPIGTFQLSDIYLYDALGRRSEIPQSITIVVGSVNVTSSFDDSQEYKIGSFVNVDYRITSVAREVIVQIVFGGKTMINTNGEIIFTNIASQTTTFDLVLSSEEDFIPTQGYSQNYTTDLFSDPGEYTIQITVWAKDDERLKSTTITKSIIVLMDDIVYVSSSLDVNKDYRVNNTVILPVTIYHTRKDCVYKVRAWLLGAENVSVETAVSRLKNLEIAFALPDEANSYTICLQAIVVEPVGFTYAKNVKYLTLNVKAVSKYAVLTAPEYALQLYLSGNGMSNKMPDWQLWKNKYYLSQDYFGVLNNYAGGVNGWEEHVDGTNEYPAKGDCLYSNGESYCTVNYTPFKNFSQKAIRAGEGVTLEVMLHNSGKYGTGLCTFSIWDSLKRKGIVIDTQRLSIQVGPTKVITVPVRTGSSYLTKTGEFIANSEEFLHLTITYDVATKMILVFCNGVISAIETFTDIAWIETDAEIIINGYRKQSEITGFSEGKVRFIRCYQKCLGFDEVLNNYIASIYYDKDREYAEVINDPANPFLTRFNVLGNLSGATKDIAVNVFAKLTIGKEASLFSKYVFSPLAERFVEQKYADLSELHPITASWQGNSSLAYPIKNWEFCFFDPESDPDDRSSKSFNMVKHANGERPWYYSDEYHCKTNYIDSSGCNNQGIAKIAHYIYNVPWTWTEEECIKYCNGCPNPFPFYILDDGSKSKYPVKPTRLAIDAIPFVLNRQEIDAAGNLLPIDFGGFYTWGLKQNEKLYGMRDYKEDKWRKNTIWRSESNGDSVHPQLRAGSYGLFDLSKMNLKVDMLDRPLSQGYIDAMGLIEGVDYFDLDLPERAEMRAEQMRWRVGAETVMDFECRNPKSLGKGHWEVSLDGHSWMETNDLIDPKDVDPSSTEPDRLKRWVWDEMKDGKPNRTKGISPVGYFDMMLTNETVPFIGSEVSDTGMINKSLGILAAQQHADFISAMRWVDNAPDECFANPKIIGKYFHLQSCIDYVITCLVLYLSDSLGRNLTFVQWDTREIDQKNNALLGGMPVFYPVFYDMDTALGTNVQGTLTEDPFKGWQYPIGNIHDNGKYYRPEDSDFQNYNCGESRFFRRLSALYGDTIVRRYVDLRSGVIGQEGVDVGVLTHNFIISTFCKEIISRVGERVYNEDARYKYIGMEYDSMDVADAKRKYLGNARGNKLPFINQFLLDRLSYTDSLLRYEPQGSAVSEMIYFQHRFTGLFTITLKTGVPSYIRISFAQNQSSYVYSDGITEVSVSYTYQSVGDEASEKILRIYNAAPITELYGFTNRNVTKAKLSTASSLRKLDLSGNSTLNELDLRGCRALEDLDISDCNFSGGFNVDMENCALLKRFIAPFSTVRAGDFSKNPYMEEIDVRNCPNVINLSVQGLKKIKRFLYTPDNIVEFNISDMDWGVYFNGLNFAELTTLICHHNNLITDIVRNGKSLAKLKRAEIHHLPNLKNVRELFKDNVGIDYLDDSLLEECPSLVDFYGILKKSSIRRIPTGVVNAYHKVADLSYAFEKCSKLEDLNGLLCTPILENGELDIVNNPCSNVVKIDWAFSYCTSLKSLPDGFLGYAPALVGVGKICYGCTSLVSFGKHVLSYTPKITYLNNAFDNVGKNKEINLNEDFLKFAPELTDVSYLFQNAGDFDLPSNCLINSGKIRSVQHMFSYSKVRSIPANFLLNSLNILYFDNMFNMSNNLKCVSPDYWNRENVVSFSNYASGASFTNLNDIPRSWGGNKQ